MSQSDLNRAVARATGESVAVIEQRGFSPLVIPRPAPRRRPAGCCGTRKYRTRDARQAYPAPSLAPAA